MLTWGALVTSLILLVIKSTKSELINRAPNSEKALIVEDDCASATFASHAQPGRQRIFGEIADEAEADSDGIFLAPHAAKSLLRVKRGWTIKHIWGEGQREERRQRERSNEHRRRVERQRHCRANCWGGWGSWSGCTVTCGSSGIRHRQRFFSPPGGCSGHVAPWSCAGPGSQTQACNRHCSNGGSLRSTDCRCPPAFTGRCCETRVTCSFPGHLSHGAVTPGGSSHHYGVTARYTCNTGYRLHGSSTRTCQSNGQWSGSPPRCQIVNCGDPGAPLHGTRAGSSYVYNARVSYSCNSGYNLVGASSRTCRSCGNWKPAAPHCTPVDCGPLQAPADGDMDSTGTIFQSVATFSCDRGFYQWGPTRRVCQANGQWDGSQITCSQIFCSVLSTPRNGDITPDSNDSLPFGTTVEISCNQGFRLQGGASRTCGGLGPEGVWTGSQPTCAAVDCGNPGIPEHGTKQGGIYTYPNVVAFKCLPGYKMTGSTQIQCLANGTWTDQKPLCEACGVNTYKKGLNSLKECELCPPNSHTLTSASDDLQRCLCDEGYEGVAGVCTEILCSNLSLPAHASILSCDNHVGSTCNITCTDGYSRVSGNELRQCFSDGSWTGQELVCKACPENTYKSEAGVCEPCPSNSRTTGTGHNITGCICNEGFLGSPGQPCQDADECASVANCSQECVNTYGSFHCVCNLPGFILDDDDQRTCIGSNLCPPLEAPENGGLVCMQSRETNTQRCSVKCNPGFEHLIRVNEFEECGPSTNWMWSNEINDIPILPCVEEHFSGVSVEAEASYFVEDCDSITEEQKIALAQEFMSGLADNGICLNEGEAVCNIEDVTIDCGPMSVYDYFNYDGDYNYDDEDNYDNDDDNGYGYGGYNYDDEGRRFKRSADGEHDLDHLRVRFQLVVPGGRSHPMNCTLFCPDSEVQRPDCQKMCLQNHETISSTKLQNEVNKLQTLFSSSVEIQPSQEPFTEVAGSLNASQAMPSGETPRNAVRYASAAPTLTVSGVILKPLAILKKSRISPQCPPGMVYHDKICAPCPPGSYHPDGINECSQCPPYTYQPDQQQQVCLPCAHYTSRGSSRCNQSDIATNGTHSVSGPTFHRLHEFFDFVVRLFVPSLIKLNVTLTVP